jgi:hypothetical protein
MQRRAADGSGAATRASTRATSAARRSGPQGPSLVQGLIGLQRSAGNAAATSLLHGRGEAAPVVQRSIEWSRNWQTFLWKDQVKKGEIDAGQRPEDAKAQMRDAVLAAAKANPDNVALVAAVQDVAEFDVDEIDRLAKVRSGRGLLTFPTVGAPENADYFAAEEQRRNAKTGGYVNIQSGIHISLSLAKPHMTIDVYAADGKSNRYHLLVAWDGGAWKYAGLEKT